MSCCSRKPPDEPTHRGPLPNRLCTPWYSEDKTDPTGPILLAQYGQRYQALHTQLSCMQTLYGPKRQASGPTTPTTSSGPPLATYLHRLQELPERQTWIQCNHRLCGPTRQVTDLSP